MTATDWAIIVVYFLGLAGVVWFSSQRQATPTDYFLAGRNVPWYVVGASLFASNIGSEHIVGLAGNGASSGMAMAHWELHAWIIMLLAWVFLPFYYRTGVFTMPEFLERRFSSHARWLLSVVSLVAYVFTKVSVTVYAGGMVFGALLSDAFGGAAQAFWAGALTTVALTGVYTVFGGLRAVVYTDAAQTVILLLGSVFITYFGLSKLGGWAELQSAVAQNAEAFSLWRPLGHPDFPWLGILIASPIVGIWYWCTDQYIVQRTLAARNLRDARRGAIWGGFLKVWPVFIFIIPGLIGYALHANGLIQLPVDAEGNLLGDQVFAAMVAELLPTGLRGLVVAGLLAALMSSLSSLFNSCASLFTVDIYEKIRPEASQAQLVRVGRMATFAVVALGVLWIPIMPAISGGGLYQYLQSVQGYLAPPITAVFLLGLFVRHINARGALWGLGLGFAAGMFKLSVQALVGAEMITGIDWLVAVGEYNFLYASGWLFVLGVTATVVGSLTAPAQSDSRLSGLTWSTLSQTDREAIARSWGPLEVLGTAVVLGLVVAVYLYFSFWL